MCRTGWSGCCGPGSRGRRWRRYGSRGRTPRRRRRPGAAPGRPHRPATGGTAGSCARRRRSWPGSRSGLVDQFPDRVAAPVLGLAPTQPGSSRPLTSNGFPVMRILGPGSAETARARPTARDPVTVDPGVDGDHQQVLGADRVVGAGLAMTMSARGPTGCAEPRSAQWPAGAEGRAARGSGTAGPASARGRQALGRVRRGRRPLPWPVKWYMKPASPSYQSWLPGQAQQRRVDPEVRVGTSVGPVDPVVVVVDVTGGVDHVAGDHHKARLMVISHRRAERGTHYILRGVLLPGVADDHKSGDVRPLDDPQLRGRRWLATQVRTAAGGPGRRRTGQARG